MLPEMEGLSYKERLDRLGLCSLGRRKLRGDLIEVYKIMRAIDKVNGRCLAPTAGNFKIRSPNSPRGQLRVNHIAVGLESHVGQT
eukprot:g21632.t1